MILNELIEVLFWNNINEYISFQKENDAKYGSDNPDEYFKQRNIFLVNKIKTKETFIKFIENYNISGKPVWLGSEQKAQNCDNMRNNDISDALRYGSYEHGEEIYRLYEDMANTWAIHIDDYGNAVNNQNNNFILELTVGAGLGTCAVISNLLPDSHMISADIDFRCAKNADGLAKYFKVDDRVCGINANLWLLPFEDSVFDTVCTHYGLDELREVPTVLKETSRVLKKGGKFIVMARKYPFNRHSDIMGLFNITEKECNSLLKKSRMYSGFDDLAEGAGNNGLILIDQKVYEPENSHHRIMYTFQKC